MVLRKLLAAVFLVVLTSTTALAEVRQGAVTVSPFVGGYLFEGDQGLKTNNFMCGLGMGYLLTDHIGIEGVFGYINAGRKDIQPDFKQTDGEFTPPAGKSLNGAFLDSGPADAPFDGRVNGYLYKIEGLYHFNPTGKLVPFVAAGFGGLTLDPAEGRGGTTAIFDYGAGLQYFLSENLAFRTDVRHVIELNEGENNLMYTAGLTYYIGGGKPAPAPVAVTPPPAPAPEPAPAPKVEAPAPAPEPVPERKVEETPAPAPEPAKPAPLKQELVIDVKVEFDFDKSFVRPIYHDELERVSRYLKEYPDNFAVLEGHTDGRGTVKYNERLSQKRADSVRQYMIDNFGVDGTKLSAKGYGKSRPIASNDTDEGRQRNRRTELHIKPLAEMSKEVKDTKPEVKKAKKARKAKKAKKAETAAPAAEEKK